METFYQVIEIAGQSHLDVGPQFATFAEASRFMREGTYDYINYWDGSDWQYKVRKEVDKDSE